MAPVAVDNVGDGETSGDESSQGSSAGSGAPSPARSRSGSRSSHRSGSHGSHHSRSRSRSASSNASGAGSGAENKASKKKGDDDSSSGHSRAGSPAKSRSRSGSRSSGRSGSKSPGSHHSRSRSRSQSGDEQIGRVKKEKRKAIIDSASDHSGAPSPTRSRSGSRSSARSGTKSPVDRRSKSKSPGNESGGEKKNEAKPPDSSQLFGDADDISDDDQDSDAGSKKDEAEKSDAENEKEDKKSDEEEVEEKAIEDEPMEVEEPLPETRIDVEIPKITTDLGKGIHFVKLPNFLSVETRPFDPNTYEDEIDEEETLDEEGRARLKLKVENTIRWRERFNERNVFVKESNARFVRWSDGSLSLHLGSEIFNVHKQPLQGDHNHLFIRQGTGLQGQAVFRTKLTFRPHSTESFTHRKMTMSLADRSQKTSGIKVLSMVGHDPEAQRFQMIKKEEDKLRASLRRESKQRRIRERATSRGLTSNYLEPDRYDNDEFSDEDNTISLSAIKNRYKKNAKMHSNIYSSEDEDDNDDDEGVRVGKKTDRPKRLKDSEDESDGVEGDQVENSPPPTKVEPAHSGSNSD